MVLNRIFRPRVAAVLALAVSVLALPATAVADSAPAARHTENSVIGSDDRHQVNDTLGLPFSAIALVEALDENYDLLETCTGALVGPDAVLTAAHCLWQPDSDRHARHVRITPGKNGALEPFGGTYATDWWIPDGFIASDGDPVFDFALLRLPGPELGARTGWLTIAALDDATLADPAFTPAIAGYPTDEPTGTIWVAEAERFAAIDTFLLAYTVDTGPGESGAPIWSARPGSPLYGRVVGIHTHGGSEGAAVNTGARIDAELLADLLQACDDMRCTLSVSTAMAPLPATRPNGLFSPAIARD